MGFPDQHFEGQTLKRRRQTCDSIIEEIYGGPQSRENFVVRTREINKLLDLKLDKFRVYRTRKALGLAPGHWYNRTGFPVETLPPFFKYIMCNEKPSRKRKADFIVDYCRQMALDLGDDGLPTMSACKILWVAPENRWFRDGKGPCPHETHPLYPPYKKLLKTAITTKEGLHRNYDCLYSSRLD